MALGQFIPTIWSAKLFTRLRKALVFGAVVNTDYEGEIKEMGDSVKINEVGSITVNDYSKYTAITWQQLTAAQKILIIDKAKSFSFTIDDIDQVQSKPKVLNAAMEEAAYAIADTIDQFLAGLYTGAGVKNDTYMGTSGTGLSVSSGNVIEVITYMGRYLSESNVPAPGRTMVLTPWLHQKLLLAEVGGISATAVPKVTPTGEEFVSGYVGRALGFDFLVSNNVQSSATGVSAIMAFNKSAISYAGQVSKVETVRRESYFDTGVKGLYVYGGKVVRPEALGVAHLKEAAG